MKKHDLEQEVAELLQREHHGMLSTFVTADCDDKAAGFPFGSVVRFVIGQSDQNKGAPILLLSRIAEHSKHIAQQNKASLLISETDAKKDIQQQARLTLLGTMRRLSIDDPALIQDREAYFAQYPESRDYFQLLDFDFYFLKIEKKRYVAGFGRAYWLTDSNAAES
jgi:hypothetical protein